MRFAYKLALAALATAWSPLAPAQTTHAVTLGANYTYVRTNVLPGCGCYSLNGGGIQAQYGLIRHLALLTDFTVAHKGGITQDNYTLTQFTYTGGVRYSPLASQARVRPFAEITLGGATAYGTLSPTRSGVGGNSNTTFAFQSGGGVAIRLSSRLSLVPIEADYLMTSFTNDANDRQNDLRLSSGIQLRLWR